MKRSYLIIVIVVLLVLLAGGIGWRIGHSSSAKNSASPPARQANASSSSDKAKSSVGGQGSSSDGGKNIKTLVSYTLPDGWQEVSCNNAVQTDKLYVLPPNVSVDCAADPSAPVSLAVDTGITTNCQQLEGQANVRTHTCKSSDVNGKKSLQSTTDYTAASNYGKATTVTDYFVQAGDKVVKVEYRHSAGDNAYQASFDRFASNVFAR